MRVVALSGPIASGKSSVAEAISQLLGATVIDVSALLKEIGASTPATAERAKLAALGDRLADASGGHWLVDRIEAAAGPLDADTIVVIDAVRRPAELAGLRAAAPQGCQVLHVFLYAANEVLRDRHIARSRDRVPYEVLARHPGEAALPSLHAQADLRLNTASATPAEIAEEIVVALRDDAENRNP